MYTQKIKDFLFPHFSESDAFALLISMITPFVFSYANFRKLENSARDIGTSDAAEFLIIFLFWAALVIKNVIVKDRMSLGEKKTMARIFYFTIALMTLFSSMDMLLRPVRSLTFFGTVNLIIVVFMFLKSILSLVILRLSKVYENMFDDRVTDEQARLFEIIYLIISTSLIFLFINKNYSIVSSILLIYFYSTSLLDLGKTVLVKDVKPEEQPLIVEKRLF